MCIDPTTVEASLGQNRAQEYDASPSIEESCEKGDRMSARVSEGRDSANRQKSNSTGVA